MSALPPNKHTPADASGGNINLTLPTGAAQGALISVEKYDSTANTVTISGNIRSTAGAAVTLYWAKETVVFVADAAGSWWPYAGHKTKTALDGAYGSFADVAQLKTQYAGLSSNLGSVGEYPMFATELSLVAGSSTFGPFNSRIPRWPLAHGAATYLVGVTRVPSDWATADIYIDWINEAANAGNVSFGIDVNNFAVGDQLNTAAGSATSPGQSFGSIVAANSTAGVLVQSKIAAGATVTPSKRTQLRVVRNGASGNDTLTSAAGIVGLRLVKAS